MAPMSTPSPEPVPETPVTTLAEAAARYLPPDEAAAWTALLRPAFHLREHEAGDPVVGYLGGSPFLPADAEWPVWTGHGPLSFIGAIDCGSVPAKDLDIALPEDGALLFFYFDGQVQDEQEVVVDADEAADAEAEGHPAAADEWDDVPADATATTPDSPSRVLYVPADADMAERDAPEPIAAYARILLAGDVLPTEPDFDHHAFRAAFGDPYDPASPHAALSGDDFTTAVDEVRQAEAPLHQIGGYARPVQGSVENESARAVYPVKTPETVKSRAELAEQLVLLAQIDSDYRNDMDWGDAGCLYWMIHPDDLAARNFDAALFTWQSH
jgi:hypothetical protein